MCAARGLTVAATCVDHIVSKRKGGSDAVENLQPLCSECHQRKTNAGD
jgi:5-methylcytosine-specific restriction protein A